MAYRGHIENGVVVLDDAVSLPEGAEVTVDLAEANAAEPSAQTEPNAPAKDAFWGLFAADADLVDRLLADTMRTREERRLRDANV